MDARELRIGNTVESFGTNGNPNAWVAITVNADHIKTCESHPEWFRPIKITKVLLKKSNLKLGISSWDIGYVYDKEYSGVKIYSNHEYVCFFEYIHQLQNFCALVGEEINIDIL